MRRLALFFALSAVTAVLAAGCGGGGGGSVSKGDVASVGSAHIKKSQLDALLAQAQRSYKLQKRPFPKVGSPEYQTLQSQAIQYLVQRPDFAALAKKYSQDPGSKSAGGKLTISKGQTVPQFDKIAFSLKTNQLSKPVHTQYGWHVIQALSAIKPSKKTPLTQVKAAIKQQLLQQKKNDAMQKWLNGLDKEFKPK